MFDKAGSQFSTTDSTTLLVASLAANDASRDRALETDAKPQGSTRARRGSVAAADALDRARYERFVPMVQRIAVRLARRLPREIALQDLVNCGWVGLLDALRRAPESLEGEQLDNFAACRARGAMLDYLRSADIATRGARRAARQIADARRRCESTLGRAPTDDETRAELKLDAQTFTTLLTQAQRAAVARSESIDTERADYASPTLTPDEAVFERQQVVALSREIEALPARLQQVLALYYQHECTLRQVGAVLGVTESRASQLHSEAVARLRAALHAA